MRAGDQLLVGETGTERILDHNRADIAAGLRRHQRLEQRAIDIGVLDRAFHHDIVERGAGGAASVAAGERGVERQFARRQDGDPHLGKRHLRQLRDAQIAERRVLQAFDPYRDDNRVRLVGNQPGAFIDFHQAGGDREAAFGENDQGLASFHDVDQVASGERLGRIHRVSVDQF